MAFYHFGNAAKRRSGQVLAKVGTDYARVSVRTSDLSPDNTNVTAVNGFFSTVEITDTFSQIKGSILRGGHIFYL